MKDTNSPPSSTKALIQELCNPLDDRTPEYKPIRNLPEEVEAFRDNLFEIYKLKLDELREVQNRVDKAKLRRDNLISKYPELVKLELHLLVGAYTLVKEQNSINMWQRYWIRLNPEYIPTKRTTGFSESEIESARAHPIQDLLDTDFKNAGGGKLKALCPVHEERSPSFIIYTNKNNAHCFGCRAHFNNAIDFLIQKDNVNFQEAVGRLL